MRGFIGVLLAALALALAGCKGGSDDSVIGSSSAQGKSTSFVAFGDAGKGSAKQIAVGEAMGEVCRLRGCDFALELGDNFYDAGVQSVSDEQFQTKFEIPYQSLKVPVYVTLGNHDNSLAYGEGADNARGDHQVEYHYLAGRTSEKWRMPARYYNFTAPLGGSGAPLVEFFSLDSNPLTALVSDLNPAWNYVDYQQEQQQWFEQGLQESKAHWKVAFAHHPYLSNGLHGNAGNFDGVPPQVPIITTGGKPWKDMLDATLCEHGVDLFVAGHDHDLEWLKPLESCGKTHFIVSGAAEGPRPFSPTASNATYWKLDNTLGFFWIKLDGDKLTAAAYTLGGDLKLTKDESGRVAPAFEQTVVKQ